jgi:hypothetical protein
VTFSEELDPNNHGEDPPEDEDEDEDEDGGDAYEPPSQEA